MEIAGGGADLHVERPRGSRYAAPATLARTAAANVAAMEVVEIKVRENGPYKVTGPVRLIDADGNEFELPDDGRPIALCRCGGSKTKPFCDKTHSKIGFQAAERAVAEADAAE